MVQKEMSRPDCGSPPVLVLGGPTGSGKTRLGILLAKELNAEIINADSRQVYMYMDIGTAKPTPEERKIVQHHLIDVVEPDQEFNAQSFRNLAEKAVQDITGRKRRVILAGGTGLYIKAFLEGLAEGASPDPGIRQRLKMEKEQYGLECMYRRLNNIDPELSCSIHPNDEYRILRALEIYEVTGRPPSELRRWGMDEIKNKILYLGIELDRQKLYDNINRRTDMMVKNGLVEEVRGLLERGYSKLLKSMRTFGYREIIEFLNDKISLSEATALIKKRTRQYAKRQITWFKAVKNIVRVNPEAEEEILLLCNRFFEEAEHGYSTS